MVCLRLTFDEPWGTGVAVDGDTGSSLGDTWRCLDCGCLNDLHQWACYRCGAGQPEDDPAPPVSQQSGPAAAEPR